jgi:hypothetical protein
VVAVVAFVEAAVFHVVAFVVLEVEVVVELVAELVRLRLLLHDFAIFVLVQ